MTDKLSILSPSQHHALTFKHLNDFSFASEQHRCPLLAAEMFDAANSYPILFPAGDIELLPQAIFSLEPKVNPRVGADKGWNSGYMPLNYRKYPFYLGRDKEADTAAILFDAAAPHFAQQDGQALYQQEGDQFTATQLLQDIKSTLQNFDGAYQETVALCRALDEAEVLEPAQIYATRGEEKRLIEGFRVVSWQKVVALGDDVLAQWSRVGLVQVIYCHMQSIRRLQMGSQTAKAEA